MSAPSAGDAKRKQLGPPYLSTITMLNRRKPFVYLVGAGPGNPGLLTLRAVEALAEADVVIYDKLVPPRLLDHAPDTATRLCVGELPGSHPDRWPHIHEAMIDEARRGQCVVRLKGGDPFIFGRGGEEAEALRRAGIPFEVVPGVTSGLGAAAFAGIPLTHRAHASAVALITGHENPSKPDSNLDWAALAKFPGTLVIYMGISRLPLIVQVLLGHGKDPMTPAAVIHRATTGDQLTLEAPLRDLPTTVQNEGIAAPAIVIVGEVVSLRPEVTWFEQLPLYGKRVLVTRPRHQASGMVRQLEQLGAMPFVLPTVEIQEPADWGPVDRALANLASYQWMVFTSANGVHALLKRLRKNGRDLRALGHLSLAAIGPATADVLRSYHLEPDLIPPAYRSESLAAELAQRAAGQRLLYARADRGRDVLRQELAGVAVVDEVAVYAQVDRVTADSDVLDCLRRGEIDYVTLTSSNIARSLIQAMDEPCRSRVLAGDVKLISISPVTSAAIAEMGLPVAGEATEYTTDGLLRAVLELAAS